MNEIEGLVSAINYAGLEDGERAKVIKNLLI